MFIWKCILNKRLVQICVEERSWTLYTVITRKVGQWAILSVIQIESLFAMTDSQQVIKVTPHSGTGAAPVDAEVSNSCLRSFHVFVSSGTESCSAVFGLVMSSADVCHMSASG